MMEWTIRDITIPNQTVLGPMAGVTDLPVRLLCREQGAGLVVTEMISAKALTLHNRRTEDLMRSDPAEAPVSLQLFGHDPSVMAEAVRLLEEKTAGRDGRDGEGDDGSAPVHFDILDINMGCPMPKITGNQEGSALMRDPAMIERLVRACVENSSRPVTVKLRTGYDHDHINAVDCALAAEAGGASMIAVHGRTRTQMYAGEADWSVIRDVAGAVRVPVVGNGDITDGPSARRMLDETGCRAVMIARAARGNPWIFREVNHYLETGKEMERPAGREIIRTLLRHAEMTRALKGDRTGIQEMRGQASWYLRGFPGAARLRAEINKAQSFEELEGLLHREFPYA